MRFAWPFFLLLLPLAPLLAWLRWRVRDRRRMLFSDVTVLRRLPRSWRVRLQPLLPVLYAAGLACLVVALARPQRGLEESIVHTEGVDIVLLIDLSKSMDTPDFIVPSTRRAISRLDAAKDVIERFLRKRPNDRIGIVAFASMPYVIAPLTLDHDWLITRLQDLDTDLLGGKRTAIGDGIASAVNRLRDSKAKSKVIILLTDGANNYGTLSPENAAQAAAALGIKIYTIGVGGGGSPFQGFFGIGDEVDEATLQKIADISGGKFFRARDLRTLQAVYDEIDKLEKSEITVKEYTRFEDKAGGWILAGLLLLAAEQWLSLTRMGRVT